MAAGFVLDTIVLRTEHSTEFSGSVGNKTSPSDLLIFFSFFFFNRGGREGTVSQRGEGCLH